MHIDQRLARALPYVVAGALAGYLLYDALHIQYHARAGTLGPDFWPAAILVLAIIVCVVEAGRIMVTGAAASEGVLEGLAGEPPAVQTQRHPWVLLAGMGATLAYVELVQILGFFLATVAYLTAFIALGGYRRWKITAAVSIIGALVLMFVFMKLVYVSLPIGVAPFNTVTFLLMQLMGVR